MAKVSARGASKLAEASIDTVVPTPDSISGGTTRYFYVLRSDGAILSTFSWPNAASSYDRSRHGYTIAAKVKPGNDLVEVFTKYVNRRANLFGATAVFK